MAFDYVEVDLPNLKGNFQTKELDNQFDCYLINSEGIHISKNKKYYKVPWIDGLIEIYELDDKKSLIFHKFEFDEGALVK